MNFSWIEADWPAPPGVVAGCTTRKGGVSTGNYASLNLGAHTGDQSSSVTTNRQRMQTECALPASPRWLKQVHGSKVVRTPETGTEADASVTAEVGVVCVVMVADCLPVLFVSDDGNEVAASHAGWRGLANGVLENTVSAFSASPANILAWLGPAISPDAFEVGDEVRQVFVDCDHEVEASFTRNDRGRWQADLYDLAKRRLLAIGISRIFGGGFCTFIDSERFFSYRRDGQCGRMASFIFRH